MKRKHTAVFVFITLLFLMPLDIKADHRMTTLAEEYRKMMEGIYPKEVNFADTAFTNYGHAETESLIVEIDGAPSEEHEFTIKAGEKVGFVMKGSRLGVLNYNTESLVSWSPEGRWDIGAAIHADGGLYMIRKDPDSYTMEVTDFGFETDLSDLTCHLVMTLDIPAVRICEESEISSLGDDLRTYLGDHYEQNRDDLKFTDHISVRAEGDAHITVVSEPGMYTGDYMMQETDTVGFQFIFDPDASWSFALNGNAFEVPKISYLYSGVWAERPDEDYDAETLYYRTMSLILVDSDLVERESTVVDKWKAEKEEREKKNSEKKEEKTDPEVEEDTDSEKNEEISAPESEEAGPADSKPEENGTKRGSGMLSTVLLIGALVCAVIAAFTVIRSRKRN